MVRLVKYTKLLDFLTVCVKVILQEAIMYKPKFLSWAKSYDHEVESLMSLINGNPGDLDLLKSEILELTGKTFEELNALSINYDKQKN